MASSPSPITLSLSLLFLLFISSSLSYASRTISPFTKNNEQLLHRLSPAERLIRSLNLFPKKPANIIRAVGEEEAISFVPGSIVENNFSFLSDSAPSIHDLGHHAGYYSLPHTKDARMFYFFFESRNSKDDPIVIWLTGGPGCGSEIALFYENGPFHITNNNLSLIWNDYGWDKGSNILFVDQPIGTGFSYASSDNDIPHDEKGVSNNLYDFLQAFFKEHSDFVKNDFYITGESYAGHYIPALASRIHQGNKKQEGILINLKGFAIGNGLTNPEIQYQAYTDFALDNKLITKSDYDYINEMIPQCMQGIKSCATEGESSCIIAKNDCDRIFKSVVRDADNELNYYDIRKKCEGSLCYDFSNVENLLNKKGVKEALGVEDMEFVSCSDTVYYNMAGDCMKNLELGIPALLEDGIRLLVYAGEYDLICNWLGNSRWVDAMEWSGQKEYKDSPIVQFEVDGAEAGTLQSYGPLSFLKVHEAGHFVPMDQPKVALEMFIRWMQGNLAVTTKTIINKPK